MAEFYANLRKGRIDYLCHTEERRGALLISSRVTGRIKYVPKEKTELVTFLKIENLCRFNGVGFSYFCK